MKKTMTILMTVLAFLCSALLQAETYEHKEGGLSIWFPDNWTINTENHMLEATSPDESAYAHLLMMEDADTLDAAVEAYGDELDSIVQDFKPKSEGEMIKLNGMDAWVIEGTGAVEGETLEISIALIVTKKAVMMMITFNTPEANAVHGQDFAKIVNSIKPL